MTHPDPHHLLGGVAPDILTPGEREALYAAALKDQALFDALGDEEALRELLADPAVRARLRQELAPRVVPLWRRPALLGVAASLLLAGLATLAVRQSRVEVPKLEPRGAPAPSGPPAPQREREAPAAVPPGPPARRRTTGQPAPSPEAAAPSAAGAAPAPAPAPAAEEVLRSEPAPAVDAAAALEKKAEAERRQPRTQDRLEAPPRPGLSGTFNLAPGVTAPPKAKAVRSAEAPPPATWTLTDLGAAGLRVEVAWPQDQHLVLLRRTAAGVEVLQPLSSGTREGSRLRASFRCPADLRQALDLYVLPSAPAQPEALPAEGPVAGYRARIHPVGK